MKAELLPKNMTQRQMETHCLLLEYQMYSIGELAERWGKSEEAIYKIAYRHGVKKVDGHKRMYRPPKPRFTKKAAAAEERRKLEKEREMQEKLVAAFYPDYTAQEIAAKTGMKESRVRYLAKKYGIKK